MRSPLRVVRPNLGRKNAAAARALLHCSLVEMVSLAAGAFVAVAAAVVVAHDTVAIPTTRRDRKERAEGPGKSAELGAY